MGSLFGLKSSRIFQGRELKPGLLLVEDKLIKEVLPYQQQVACPVEDVGNLVIMPGAIDAHVHINEPGRSDWEGFRTATQAAVAGGTTTVVDMPLNSNPVTTSVQALNEKIEAAQDKMWCNLGLYGGVIPGNLSQIEPLLKAGVLGIKAFMCPSGLDEFPAVSSKELRMILPILKAYDRPLLVHAELEDAQEAPEFTQVYSEYANSRPASWELAAINQLIKLVKEFNTRVHIVHLATAQALKQIQAARESWPLSVETCPHYLLFNDDEIGDGQTQYKCAPPIRSAENQKKLIKGLQARIIDFMATDHSPAPAELKHFDSGDFISAWGGIGGIQWLLCGTWTVLEKQKQSIAELVQMVSQGPAQFLGLEHKKGRIASGYDADLVLWDPHADSTVTEKNTYFKHKTTPYLNRTLKGRVHQTYVNGVLTFDQGDFNAASGSLILK